MCSLTQYILITNEVFFSNCVIFLACKQDVLRFVEVMVNGLQTEDLRTLYPKIVNDTLLSTGHRKHFRGEVICGFDEISMHSYTECYLLRFVEDTTAIIGSHSGFDTHGPLVGSFFCVLLIPGLCSNFFIYRSLL